MMWPLPADLDPQISEHQRAEYWKATQGIVGILGGGPGCGKTFVVGALCKRLAATIGIDNIRIGAPTGKAAVRVTENLSKHGLTIRARTWHSLLASLESTGSDKFPEKVLIGDETSMNDTDLMAAIFRARSAGCHVLLVGDVHQLPPVGHGAPLRDLITSGLPYGELTEIKRNSGGIVETCAAIKNGQRWTPGDNLVLEEASTPTEQIREMLEWIADRRSVGLDPIWDCQVVVPVNKKSPLARQTLNKILQRELNTNGGEEGSPFWVGDKIVNTANGYFPAIDLYDDEESTNDRGETYVANGELAKVVQVNPGYLVAELTSPKRTIKIPRGRASNDSNEQSDDGDGANSDKSTGTGCSWDLGYALSVHKSQGSEWPVVLVMLDDYAGAKMVCSREWLYTAISRAKELCVMIGKRETADSMCRRIAIGNRKTLLKERIHAIQAVNVLAEM